MRQYCGSVEIQTGRCVSFAFVFVGAARVMASLIPAGRKRLLTAHYRLVVVSFVATILNLYKVPY